MTPPGCFLLRLKHLRRKCSPNPLRGLGIKKFMNKIINFVKEVIGEARHVTWPTRKQTVLFTVAVLAISIIVAYYLGLLDFIFSKGLGWLLIR